MKVVGKIRIRIQFLVNFVGESEPTVRTGADMKERVAKNDS